MGIGRLKNEQKSSLLLKYLEGNFHQNLVNITITGPVGRWFGVGFGSYTMANNPYAIIVSDKIFEVKLDDHSPGSNLSQSFTLLEDIQIGGFRKIRL